VERQRAHEQGNQKASFARTLIFPQAEGWQKRSRKAISLRENHQEAGSTCFGSDCLALPNSQEQAQRDTVRVGTAGVCFNSFWETLAFFEEGLCLCADLKDAHAPHIQEVSSLCMHNVDERGIADGAAHDRSHSMHVGGGRTPYRWPGHASFQTGRSTRKCHFDQKRLSKRPACYPFRHVSNRSSPNHA
jgi:hypothetical protein